MTGFLEAFFSMGIFTYIIIGMFILSFIYMIVVMKMNKSALNKWLSEHPNSVKIELASGHNVITSNALYARVVSGEAAIFTEKSKWVMYAEPGDIVIEATYEYVRPGVLYKTVKTAWGPANIELTVEREKEYILSFDKKEEQFKLSEK